jgi:hypothetical protein
MPDVPQTACEAEATSAIQQINENPCYGKGLKKMHALGRKKYGNLHNARGPDGVVA